MIIVYRMKLFKVLATLVAVVKAINTDPDHHSVNNNNRIENTEGGLDMDLEELFCSATSPQTGNFFNLSPLSKSLLDNNDNWRVRGVDFVSNFTINICGPLINDSLVQSRQFMGLNTEQAKNVSAMYIDELGGLQSIGSVCSTPYFRGRNLILEYINGSPCFYNGAETPYNKSSIFTFKCDREVSNRRAAISYVANSNNCSFYFEVKTPHACPSADVRQSLSPTTIFVVITSVAIVVYLVGVWMFSPNVGLKAYLPRSFLMKHHYRKEKLPV